MRCNVGRRLLLGLVLCAGATAQAQAPRPTVPPVASLDSAWASIARTYYDTALINGRWRIVYDSLHAALANANDDAVRTGIRRLIGVPGQSHFALLSASAADAQTARRSSASRTSDVPGTTGVDLRFFDGAVRVSTVDPESPAANAGIRAGDALRAVDGTDIGALYAKLAKAMPEDERQARFLAVLSARQRVSGAAGDTVRLVTSRSARANGGRRRTRTLVLAPLRGTPTRYGNLPPMMVSFTRDSVTIGRGAQAAVVPVIGWSQWMPSITRDLDAALFAAHEAPGLILDLRGNTGGVMGMIGGVAGHVLDTAANLGTMHGRGATITLRANPRIVNLEAQRVPIYRGPLAILVDEFSASASEFFAGGLQGLGRARVFGTTSAGMSLPAVTITLPNGDVLMHPIADHVDAIGRKVEGVGIIPDEMAPLRQADLVAGRDAALEAARAWLATVIP